MVPNIHERLGPQSPVLAVNVLPSVSAIIPVFNSADTLARSIASVLDQSSPVTEIVVVDDASSDHPEEVLKSFKGQSVPVRLLRHAVNCGAAAARNTGVRAASGELVAFLDSDDAWYRHKTKTQLAAIENAGPSVWACVGGFDLFRAGRPELQIYRLPPLRSLGREMAWGCRLSPGSTLMVRRTAFDVVGFYDETMRRMEDWDWLIRLSKHSEIVVVSEPIAEVHLSYARGNVNAEPTFAALDSIHARHAEYFLSLGGASLRRFRATLELERAAASARSGRRGRAALLMLAAMTAWPFQRRSFFDQILRGLTSAFGPRGGSGSP